MNRFGNENITSSSYYSSALLCGLKLGGSWTNARERAAVVNVLGITAVWAGAGCWLRDGEVSHEDYTLTDITSLTM
jgi:hypothetical protein